MSRASREADIAAAEAYFEKIRNTPDPDWAQEGEGRDRYQASNVGASFGPRDASFQQRRQDGGLY